MKTITFSFKSLLVACGLLMGSANAWGQTTAFSQDFTAKGESTDPSDYGFALSYGSGSSAEKVAYSVTDGVLKCDANAGESKARTGLALATFSEISSKKMITVSYKWQITAGYAGANTETYIGNSIGKALNIKWEPTGGTTSQGNLTINGQNAFVSTDQRALRGSTYTVTAILDLGAKKITSLVMTNSVSSTWNYTLSGDLDFYSDISTIDRFGFSNQSKSQYTQTTSLDDLSVTYEAYYNYTINAVDGSSNILKTLKTGNAVTNATVDYAYPKYINVNGTLYHKDANNKVYGSSFSLTTDNQIQNVTYAASSHTNVLYFCEAEDILTSVATGNVAARCSNKAGGYTSSATNIVTLPAGTYTIGMGGYASEVTHFYAYKNSESEANRILDYTGNGGFGEQTASFTLAETTDILVKGGGTNYAMDYIFFKGTPDNEIIGAVDKSTAFMGLHKDFTISQGQTINVSFNNHGTTSAQWYNWLVRLSGTSGVDHTFRADNYVIGDHESIVSTRSITMNDGAIDWETFKTDMADAEVEMAITYTVAGAFSIKVTATKGTNTYVHNFAYNEAKSGAIKVELGVEYAWLEVTGSSSSAEKTSSATLEGWKTFYNADFNFEVDAQTTIYIAATPTSGDKNVILTPLAGKIIPAGEPVVLKTSNTSDYTIEFTATTSDSSDDFDANGLQVATSTGTVDGAYIMAYTTANGLGFYPYLGSLDAGDIYLTVSSPAKMLHIVVDGQATGITATEAAETEEEGTLYNTAGQQVVNDYKGIVIKNGKKYIQK